MFLPTVSVNVNENMANACEDFSEFTDEVLLNFILDFDNIPFEENTSNNENAEKFHEGNGEKHESPRQMYKPLVNVHPLDIT